IRGPFLPACGLQKLRSLFRGRTIQDANAGDGGWLPLRQICSTLTPVSAPLSFCIDFGVYFFRYDKHAAKPCFQVILHLFRLEPCSEIAYVYLKIRLAVADVSPLVGEAFLELCLCVIRR